MVLGIEILMFAVSFDFLGKGSRIQLLLLGITIVDILKKKYIVTNLKTTIMFCFLISYTVSAIANNYFSLTFASTHLACPFLMWYWGRELFERSTYEEKQLRKICYILFSGFFAMGLYALVYSMKNGLNNRMEVYSIWGGIAGHNSGIQQTIFFILPESLLLYFILFGGKPVTKGIGVIASITAIINILYFSGRSGGVIILFANSAALLFYLQQSSGAKRIKIILVGLLLAALVVIMFENNAFDLADTWQESNLYKRLYVTKSGLDSNSRIELWIKGLSEVLKAPFGSDYKYAHNFWIDIALEGGIITGLLLVVYSILSIKDVYKFVAKNLRISIRTRMFVLALYAGMLLAFSIEPIMQSLPLLAGNLFFIDSAIYEYNKQFEVGLA